MNNETFERYFPWAVVVVAGLYLLVSMAEPEDAPGKMRIQEFGKLPVVQGGRVKPLDSVARYTLLAISNRQGWKDEKDGTSPPPAQWLLDVMTSRQPYDNDAADRHEVFRIENDQVLNFLGLQAKPGFYRYSIAEIAPRWDEFLAQANAAEERDAKKRDLFDNKVLELREHLSAYMKLARLGEPFLIPPQTSSNDWQTLPAAAAQARQTTASRENIAAIAYITMLAAYERKDAESFNKSLDAYKNYLDQERPQDVSLARFESFFNHFEPFYQCSILYVFVFLLTCGAWLGWTKPLLRAAFWLAVLTLIVHSWALLARMYISGRPPVTNLYSSAVFIGWGCVILGLIIERVWGMGLGTLIASVAGSLTVLIAHNLADGDTMGMLQAVLDTNFWLATHVTIVTLGYAATFVAGLLGIVLIILGVTTDRLSKDLFRTLGQAIYGVLCFATLLSFTGTVLGGIWADQSWGRFWGWDPKENGALLIVIMNALILHARWGGLVQQRGMAVLAVLGNIVVAWSWFGVNMLGVGLHSYGFMEGALWWLGAFGLSQLVIAGLGMSPMDRWRSAAAMKAPPPSRPAPPPAAVPRDRRRRGKHSTAVTTR